MTPHETLLTVIRRFVPLTPAEEELIIPWFVAEELPKGGFFLRPGEVSRKVAFIVEGVFHNFRNRDGQEHTFYFGREQEFIGDYSSFLPAQPAVHAIQALEPARLLSISYDNLERLYRQVQQGERFGRLVAEMLFVDVLGQLTSFYEETPEERYARFVRTYPDLQQRIPQYYIASYVGVKPQSLSRIRGRAML
ncbi:Crp/Fnr family transcriptional regulator [Hymenobacter sp. GOD-10R]|uniref:Crp/Fnr family transcriptional regulator n=1 Tax=Hymenobacter sp. GOD-10R TaxID=3093922 RepID=UPI002D767C71|nr:Crp/Fnr family transcriptional regulator [Hymenobacter sp. GOD-10R]WRQ30413.1 Crp/Fnr family transcriptional regulator [Hymenobacter sp. GOD-10R]